MTILRNLVNTAREAAHTAQDAAGAAQHSVEAAVRPVRDGLAETQHELEQQSDVIANVGTDLNDAATRIADVENAVDTLILDMLMGGI